MLLIIVTILLIGLLINQVFYALNAADDQKKALNEKVEIALDIIVEKVSANQNVCKSVNNCLHTEKKQMCCKYLDGEKEWGTVDSIISHELARFNINLHYNFDFTKNHPEDKNTYAMNMDQVFSEAGVVMYLEFPDRSKYLLKQMGPVFISSILLILFITIAFILMYRYYQREQVMVTRTRDFINNMTHEFKTPLANISFASNMINRENERVDSDKIEQFTRIIQEENQRLLNNCEDLLVIGMAESDLKSSLEENVDVHQVITKAADRYMEIQEDELNIKLDLFADAFHVKGKSSMLDNTLANLVDNAIKYCDENPIIRIRTKNKNGWLLVEVTDNGKGIAKNAQDQIFEKFYRESNHDQHDVKGFGLGLSYVKMVVEQMGGTVFVQSELGKGSTFILKLPLLNE
ncbi:Adaptive-response sensory-kinase SasA [Parvicella tangerina]|uniref:histidine kinase n=2 Tax=Parvicella tangerina TaxID=2829795 RepID=A0A916JMM7_9FLAO|nr:Adaptive-response sensory-kinase SasA [Parvicella tangerina]